MTKTTKITKITPATCEMFRKELEPLMKALAEKHGVEIRIGKMSYMSENIKMPLEVAVISENGVAQTREADAFKQLAGIYGMQPSDLGKEFVVQGIGYQIIGARSRSEKFPIMCKRLTDGVTVCYGDEVVARKLGYQPKQMREGLTAVPFHAR